MKVIVILLILCCTTNAFPGVDIPDVINTIKLGLTTFTGETREIMFEECGNFTLFETMEPMKYFADILTTNPPNAIHLDGRFWTHPTKDLRHCIRISKYSYAGKSFQWKPTDVYIPGNNSNEILFAIENERIVETFTIDDLTRLSTKDEILNATGIIPLWNQFYKIPGTRHPSFYILTRNEGYLTKEEYKFAYASVSYSDTMRALLTRRSFRKMFEPYTVVEGDIDDALQFLRSHDFPFDEDVYKAMTAAIERVRLIKSNCVTVECHSRELIQAMKYATAELEFNRTITKYIDEKKIEISKPIKSGRYDKTIQSRVREVKEDEQSSTSGVKEDEQSSTAGVKEVKSVKVDETRRIQLYDILRTQKCQNFSEFTTDRTIINSVYSMNRPPLYEYVIVSRDRLTVAGVKFLKECDRVCKAYLMADSLAHELRLKTKDLVEYLPGFIDSISP